MFKETCVILGSLLGAVTLSATVAICVAAAAFGALECSEGHWGLGLPMALPLVVLLAWAAREYQNG